MKTYKPHPAAELFPMMSDVELNELAGDILDRGQLQPIILTEAGLILDGRNRMEACRRAKVEPEIQMWDREDDDVSPTAWVLSANLRRRHLTESQKAMIAVDSLKLFQAEAKARQKAGGAKGGSASKVSAHARTASSLTWTKGADGDPVATSNGIDYSCFFGAGGKYFGTASGGDEAFEFENRGPFESMQEARDACELFEQYRDAPETEAKRPVAKKAGKGKAAAAAAKAIGVGTRIVEQAKALVEKAPRAELEKIRTGEKTIKQVERETKRADQVAQVRVYQPPAGEFAVIVSDPAWQYADQLDGSDASRGGCPYPTMPLAEICALKPPAAKDCILFLWTTNAFLADGSAAEVVKAWGFESKTILTWVKPRMGLGRWLRNVTEHCILAVRGSPKVDLTNQTTMFMAPVGEHSAKPDLFYSMVEKLCPSPSRIEMFARADRPGWVTTGAELKKKRLDGIEAKEETIVEHVDPPPKFNAKAAVVEEFNTALAELAAEAPPAAPAPKKKRRKLTIIDVPEVR